MHVELSEIRIREISDLPFHCRLNHASTEHPKPYLGQDTHATQRPRFFAARVIDFSVDDSAGQWPAIKLIISIIEIKLTEGRLVHLVLKLITN
jgi:hypothetical protein